MVVCSYSNRIKHELLGVSRETLDAYSKLGITVYRTDLSGTVNIISDGKALTVEEGTPEFDAKWALNISGMKIHTKDCGGVAAMAEKNMVYSVRSLAELEKFGFTRCQSCNPTE